MLRARPTTLIALSLAVAVLTLALKTVAWALTGSVGLLSDAVESIVNLVAALIAWLSLRYSARPVDATHTYGHEKIEFFSSGFEGAMVLAAALAIAWTAVARLVIGWQPEGLGAGLVIGTVAALLNGAVGFLLVAAGKAQGSIVLEANGRHLLTDLWTSVGVLGALVVVSFTGWAVLDPLVALLVAGNILWTGYDLLRRSFDGLMDHALPAEELGRLRAAIEGRLGPDMAYHALRTRQAGARRFVDFHLLVPGGMSVVRAHEVADGVEAAITAALPGVEVTIHLEPIEERASWQDSALLPIEEEARRAAGLSSNVAGPGPAAPPPPPA